MYLPAAALMPTACLQFYVAVMARWLSNYLGTKCQLPSNFKFDKWDKLVHTDTDKETLAFLKYGIPTSYQGSIHTHSDKNHASATHYPNHVRNYIAKEVSEGAMLGPFTPSVHGARQTPFSLNPKRILQIAGS